MEIRTLIFGVIKCLITSGLIHFSNKILPVSMSTLFLCFLWYENLKKTLYNRKTGLFEPLDERLYFNPVCFTIDLMKNLLDQKLLVMSTRRISWHFNNCPFRQKKSLI